MCTHLCSSSGSFGRCQRDDFVSSAWRMQTSTQKKCVCMLWRQFIWGLNLPVCVLDLLGIGYRDDSGRISPWRCCVALAISGRGLSSSKCFSAGRFSKQSSPDTFFYKVSMPLRGLKCRLWCAPKPTGGQMPSGWANGIRGQNEWTVYEGSRGLLCFSITIHTRRLK